jgi:predicted CXXCH cytochrome family protein
MSARERTGAIAAVLAVYIVFSLEATRAELPPGHEVDQQEICLACHELEGLGKRFKHAPAESGECSACHNPHVARFDALLRERPAGLCVACHEELSQALARPVVHQPVAEGRCIECHEPHGGDHSGLLVRPSKELCRECHEALTEWEARPVVHAPFDGGRCSVCHDPHAAEHLGLTSKAGGGVCAPCHGVDAAFTARHSGYPVEAASCQQCHDPHASAREGLFRARLHEPFADGDCTTCHVDSDAGEPFALVDSQGELCGACHEQAVQEARSAPFPHVSAGGGNCTDCHNPHTGDDQSLLRRETQALCLECHDPGGASSGHSGRFVTHADLECSTCHAPHGASEPLMFVVNSVELCGTCHSHEHGIRHPLGEDTRDPRTGAPMTCLSCHGIHDAPYDMYLHGSEERDLCLGCHKDIGGG